MSTTVLTIVPGYRADKIQRIEEPEDSKPAYRVYVRDDTTGLLCNDGMTYRGWNAARHAAMQYARDGHEAQVMFG